MLATNTIHRPLTLKVAEATSDGVEISRLFAAAVVNQHFRDTLLTNPEMALKSGYYGETFQLTAEERTLVLSARAKSLAELARHFTRISF